LHSTDDKTASIAAWPQLKGLYLRMNVALPASAAVEQLFSCAGLVMAHKQTKMTDKHFENLVFLIPISGWPTDNKRTLHYL